MEEYMSNGGWIISLVKDPMFLIGASFGMAFMYSIFIGNQIVKPNPNKERSLFDKILFNLYEKVCVIGCALFTTVLFGWLGFLLGLIAVISGTTLNEEKKE